MCKACVVESFCFATFDRSLCTCVITPYDYPAVADEMSEAGHTKANSQHFEAHNLAVFAMSKIIHHLWWGLIITIKSSTICEKNCRKPRRLSSCLATINT